MINALELKFRIWAKITKIKLANITWFTVGHIDLLVDFE
jgi:hypothetical protein